MAATTGNDQHRAADVIARHPNLHIRDYVHRTGGNARYEIWDGDKFVSWWTSPPDCEAAICQHLGQPVPDHVRRAQMLWRLRR